MITAIILALSIAALVAVALFTFQAGYNRGLSKAEKELINDVQKAKRVTERLNSDAEFAKRVRDKFTR